MPTSRRPRREPVDIWDISYSLERAHLSDRNEGEFNDNLSDIYSQINEPAYRHSNPNIFATMSSKRSTRAASRAATSARGASPAITENDIPNTPSNRRTSRRGNTSTIGLPAVANRPSTAYGTNATAKPTTLRPTMGAVTENLLDDLINPASQSHSNRVGQEEESTPGAAPQNSSIASSPLVDTTYSIEQAIVDDAEIASSSGLSELKSIPKPASRKQVVQAPELQNQQPMLNNIARNNRVPRPQPVVISTYGDWIRTVLRSIRNFFNHTLPDFWNYLNKVGSFRWSVLFGLMSIIIMYYALCGDFATDTGVPSAPSIGHNIGRWIPDWSSPKDYFNPDEYTSLNKRLRQAEREIVALKGRREMDPATLAKLDNILPHVVVVKKGKDGISIIPDDFWHGLRDKIRSDNSLLQNKIDASSGISESDVKTIAATVAQAAIQGSEARKVWDQFLDNNRRRIIQWQSDSQSPKPGADRKESVDVDYALSRDELLKEIEDNWKKTRGALDGSEQDFENRIGALTKRFELSLKQIAKLEGNEHIPRAQLKSLVSHYVKEMTASIQLDSQSSANIKNSGLRGQHLVNYFSKGTGAVINPMLVSPTYVLPNQNHWKITNWIHSARGAPLLSPNPPEAALISWEEHGDCWCTPINGEDGFGPSLGVMMGGDIYPTQVIVEHISSSGSLDPGAAPKDMELLALIKDGDAFHEAEEASKAAMPKEEPLKEKDLPLGWVRLGTWRYDAEALQEVQSFPLQVDLSRIVNAVTKDVIVRVKNNWGGDKVDYTCLYRVRLNGDPVKGE